MSLILVSFLQSALGIVILFGGGEILVRGTVNFARALKLPAAIIGLTVVAYGTAAPELMTSLHAAVNGSPDIALGMIIGSNVTNILLVLGIMAWLQPVVTSTATGRRDGLVMLGSSVLLLLVAWNEEITRGEGAALLAAFTLYVWSTLTSARNQGSEAEAAEEARKTSTSSCSWCAVAYILVGLAMLMTGADILVDGAASMARRLGVSEAVVGLSVVAIGTSLPELAAVIMAALRKEYNLGISTIIGSNIFNSLGIVGLSAAFVPIPAAGRFLAIDFWVLLAACLLCLAFLFTGKRLSRNEGVVFLALFVGYVITLYAFA